MGNRPLEKIQPVAKNRKRDRNDEEVSNNNKKNAKSYLWDELINDFEKDNPYGIFWKNYNNMKEANTRGADKYFHSLANCQAAQKGQVVPALKISVAREILDTPKNLIKGLSFKESINDSRDDMDANLFGLKSGLKNFNTECRYLVEKYRPDSLDEKY